MAEVFRALARDRAAGHRSRDAGTARSVAGRFASRRRGQLVRAGGQRGSVRADAARALGRSILWLRADASALPPLSHW